MTESDKNKVVRRLEGKEYGRYEFKVTLAGYGKSPEEAWNEAVEGFYTDSGEYPEDYDFEEEDE